MKKRGFTLVELLGVIAIIGVLTLVAMPSVEKAIEEGQENIYELQINNIKSGLKNWATDNTDLLPTKDKQQISLTLGQLKLEGYVEMKIQNPKNNKCFGNDMVLTITRNKKNYIYEVHDDKYTEDEECSEYGGPYMLLNGDAVMYVEVGDAFVDPGIVVRSMDGTDLSDTVTKTITGSGTSINTSVIGNEYTIKYNVIYENEKTTINRTVIVTDTTKPELVIPANIMVSKSVTNFDVMDGVSVTDNSGEDITVTSKSNISFGIPGDYIITYTAKDSSGNTAVKKRMLTISSGKTLNELAKTNDFVTTVNACATGGTCQPGTKFAIEVAPGDIKNFYVISDINNKVTLIMDSNVDGYVPWIRKSDYLAAGGTEAEWDLKYDESGNNNKGPITALNYLERETENWTNIQKRDYTYEDESYGVIKKTAVRTRMITYDEVINLGCSTQQNNCPTWVYNKLSNDNGIYGYWTSSADASIEINAWYVMFYGYVSSEMAIPENYCGVRPVIELFK